MICSQIFISEYGFLSKLFFVENFESISTRSSRRSYEYKITAFNTATSTKTMFIDSLTIEIDEKILQQQRTLKVFVSLMTHMMSLTLLLALRCCTSRYMLSSNYSCSGSRRL